MGGARAFPRENLPLMFSWRSRKELPSSRIASRKAGVPNRREAKEARQISRFPKHLSRQGGGAAGGALIK